ncbi:hypothetical protein O181_044584 [Austropuccinia psidii MF-1]|uniref:Uncharacterized protein n=1 Tax=Austropuccinia psidii MF-1 TaxID=1389203 RepID=A0A9Q3DKJ4_9BASI|nr:hypothetical protein [Austropuccinia psidii MF-1]
MASIDGKEENVAFNRRMEEKKPSTTQASSKKRQRQATSHKALQPALKNTKDKAGCHGKCIPDCDNNDGITEKGGSHIKISEMISEIFNAIPELYEAIEEIKSHVYDKNSSTCNNLKTNNLSLSQINETLMCLEKALRTIKTSNN